MYFDRKISVPSRYINSEKNSLKKSNFLPNPFRIALCFPDIYEVAMSHLGLKILYEIINSLPYASAERVFSPWIDMESAIKSSGSYLTSLETNTPLKDFDIVGFSLQYELSYTTVLNMLDLGGIPVRCEDRFSKENFYPIVVAGGPCTVNPHPMSDFIDVFLIGDGEEAVVELIDVVREWKKSGDGNRETVLKEIANLKGFYVPLFHKLETKIQKRYIKSLDEAPFPTRPIVPYTSIVHDRINIEVSRGCTQGCRFCQAGMIYRPLRQRSPEKVLQLVDESLKNTGYDEVSFTSLSAGDYNYLLDVVRECNRRYCDYKIAISLPSLRVASVNQDILREIRSVRKTGFTIAPEAATERLRRVINKNFEEDDYERALNILFSEGWQSIKLYFMIGLPTETDKDIEAIKEMAIKALHIAKRKINRFININVTISPFVPKPHTPFQWLRQISLEEIRRRQEYLKEVLRKKRIKYKGHDEKMSFLEAIFSRGDKKLSSLIEMAWRLGCRLDGWSELFDFNKWLDAMDKTGIDGSKYAQREFLKDEVLPWDNIDIGIKKEFLYKELERSFLEEKTPDCSKVCTGCGLRCEHEMKKKDKLDFSSFDGSIITYKKNEKIRVRVQYSKKGLLRYLSHLELVTAIIRGLRRAGVPFDFSHGFHPSPKLSFGPPLSVGVSGLKEYFDMDVFIPFDLKFYLSRINETLPEGLCVNKMAIISKDLPSLNSFISGYEYILRSEEGFKVNDIGKISLFVKRQDSIIDISKFIEYMKFSDKREALLFLKDNGGLKVRLKEVIETLFGEDIDKFEITRIALYGKRNNEWIEPL